jgi:hypothetical protein
MSAPTIWSEVDARLSRFLEDTENLDAEEAYLYDQALRIDAWNQAQRALAQQHTPRQMSVVLTMDTTRIAILPEDFIEVWRIYDADEQKWLKPMANPQPGAVRYDDDELGAYWIWGNRLFLEKTVATTSTDLTLYYWGYWPEVEYELQTDGSYEVTESTINVPRWAVSPLEHLASALILTPGSVENARVRQWNMKIDSGIPTNNALLEVAKNHLWWWNSLLSMVSPVQWRHGV